MQEDFLHYVWKYQLFDHQNLSTTHHQPLTIRRAGEHNFHSGPDFHTARIRLGGADWVGNLEIHIKSSDWDRHGHQHDPAYDNVILHVVWENDRYISTSSGRELPVLELKQRVFPEAALKWERLDGFGQWIPCEKSIHRVARSNWEEWLRRLLMIRLERRADELHRHLRNSKNDWEECFYRSLCERFGLRTNNAAFRLLAEVVPHRLLAKHRSNLLQVEAILFGQAGMLNAPLQDDYALHLQREYLHFARKYGLKPLPISIWKKARMRPGNFPAVRIAQLAQLMYGNRVLFANVLDDEGLEELISLFQVQTSNYWDTHYVFDKESGARAKKVGRSAACSLVINTVVPFLYVYGRNRKSKPHIDRALRFLNELSPEQNQVINNWLRLGLKPRHAGDSQALLELKAGFCSAKKCLNCDIAEKLLSP